MQNNMKKLIKTLIYFFSPEDSSAPFRTGTLSFGIEPEAVGMGSVKALFWLMNLILLLIGLSYL